MAAVIRVKAAAAAVLAASGLAACGPVETRAPAAAPEPVALDAAGLRAADRDRGEQLSFACQACHALDAGRDSPLGPNLAGVFGRRAGAVADFDYSAALADASLVWTVEALDAWLADPTGFLPGNNMAFTGYQSARDRRDLIAYLLTATGGREAPAAGAR